MKLLDRLSVRGCVMLFAAVAAIGAAAQGWVAFRVAADAQDISVRLLDSVQLARAAGTLDMMHDALRATTLRAQLAGATATPALQQDIRDEVDRFSASMTDALQRVGHDSAGTELGDAVAVVTPVVQRYLAGARKLTESLLADPSSGRALRPAFDADFEALEVALEKLSAVVEARADAQAREREALDRTARIAAPATLLATIGLILGFGLPFARGLLARLGAEPRSLSVFASRIADGELQAPFDGAAPRPGSVAAAMIAMRERLREAVGAIRLGAGQVATGSEQIRVGNDDLAHRTEEQASRLQQAAAGMSHMIGGVERTAEHARAAAGLAAGAADVAQRGGDAVRRVVSTMGEIQDSSHRIAEILAVIDGIAFQTNILALNAAVEAARAGEQGRGFAVVAGEVRALAQRSAVAAREIKTLIGGSVERVEAGNRLVADAGTTMEELVAQVRQVSALIERISREAGTQSEEIALVSRSVSALDDATQRNAALVEQSAAAAASLEEQAQRLMQSVSAFRLDGPDAAHMPA